MMPSEREFSWENQYTKDSIKKKNIQASGI